MAETITNRLKSVRNELAEIYKNKVIDSEESFTELNEIHNAIISIENALKKKPAYSSQPVIAA